MNTSSKSTTNIHNFRYHALLAMASLMVSDASASHAQTTPEPVLEPAQGSATPTPATTPEPASTEEPKKPKKRRIPPLGPEFEVFYLLDSKTRDRFGSTSGIGPGFGSTIPRMKARIRPDFSLLRADKTVDGEKNKLFVLSVGPEYRNVLVPSRYRSDSSGLSNGQATKVPSFVPYYGVGLNAIYAKVKVPGEGLDESGFGVGGTLMLGVAIKRNAVIEARVRATTKVEGYGFSGVGLTFGLRF
jgi:hypothetical protein